MCIETKFSWGWSHLHILASSHFCFLLRDENYTLGPSLLLKRRVEPRSRDQRAPNTALEPRSRGVHRPQGVIESRSPSFAPAHRTIEPEVPVCDGQEQAIESRLPVLARQYWVIEAQMGCSGNVSLMRLSAGPAAAMFGCRSVGSPSGSRFRPRCLLLAACG